MVRFSLLDSFQVLLLLVAVPFPVYRDVVDHNMIVLLFFEHFVDFNWGDIQVFQLKVAILFFLFLTFIGIFWRFIQLRVVIIIGLFFLRQILIVAHRLL